MTTEAETIDPHAEWCKQFDYWLTETAKIARQTSEAMAKALRERNNDPAVKVMRERLYPYLVEEEFLVVV